MVAMRGVKEKPDIDFLRHLILNSVRSIRTKHKAVYGEIVIACDGKKNWRKTVFPHYKALRHLNREESGFDWGSLYESIDEFKRELTEFFPYRVIDVEGAEGDDVIAVLAMKYHSEGVLIVSSDGDFKQLQKYPNICQYNNIKKKWVQESDPENYLFEHIVNGDKGDGIPNILSADNFLLVQASAPKGSRPRAKSITEPKMNKWKSDIPEKVMTSEEYRNFCRNQELIDFDYIPENVQEAILAKFEEEEGKGRNKLFNYFIEKKLPNLMSNINDF